MCKRILVDIFEWIMATLLCILWRWVADKEQILIYVSLFSVMMVAWVLLGLVLGKYRSYKIIWAWQEYLSMLAVVGIEIGLIYLIMPRLSYSLSMNVAVWMVGIVALLDAVVILILHYWKYATNMTVPVMEPEHRENAQITREDEPRSEASIATIHTMVTQINSYVTEPN